MLSMTSKRLKSQQIEDKQNLQFVGNVVDRPKSTNKENTKTGLQIKNKIKNKNLFKQTSSNKKPIVRKNTYLPEKQLRKILQPFDINKNEERNISSKSSSTKSIKSVTFSVDSFEDEKQNLSQSKSRKGSILKNRLKKEDSFSILEKQSRTSSSCSHLKSMDQAVDNPNSNSIFLRKYDKLVKELKQSNQKYTDPIYPPCEESIFLQSSYTKDFINKLNGQGYKIKWMRLTELFSEKQLCIWHSEQKSKVTKGFIHSSGKQNNYTQTVFNAINKSYIMQKFFQNQQLSKQGIYFIKMHQTQTNNWKYILIDDFVPVVVSNKRNQSGKIVKPAFLNVQSDSQIIEIWPFLLQKAFAKYYSTYDSLIKGNTLDFLQEVLGDFYQTYTTDFTNKQQNQNLLKIQSLFKNPYNVMIAENSQGIFYSVRSNQNQIQIFDTQNNYKSQKIQIEEFEKYFKFIHVIEAKKYSNHINCLIKQENLQTLSHLKENHENFILRSFTLNQNSQCMLVLTQKQERFHRNLKIKGKKGYSYSWMRMILVMKQSTGYRWIEGEYQCRKTLKMKADLIAGEYFVLILPQWKSQTYNLKLSLCSNNETYFERKQVNDHQRIIEDSCMDLAQRFGKLTQINNNICSYNYIDYKVGFIIQNINNEKTTGEVKILRTIDGLQSYNISPVNMEFLQSNRLQIKIPSFQSYTVVLKVSGGVDRTFLEQFDFGI